jgi:signal transduction histidine kinase/CheY-like chemotaxis protein
MWFIQHTLKRLLPDLTSSIDELLVENTRNIIYACGFMLLSLIFFSANLVWKNPRGFWSIFLTAFLFIGASLWTLERHVRLAQVIWLFGMGVVTIAASWLLNINEGFLLLSLLPLIAVVMIGWEGGLIVEILLGLIVLGLWKAPLPVLSISFRLEIIGIGAVCFFLGWTILRTYNIVSTWAMNGYTEARKNLVEVRQHRGQLAAAKKELDLLAYRLERANVSLVVAWRAAEEARRAKAEFVTMVSHELRTPLNLITGFSEVMLTSPENYNGIPLPGPYRSDMTSLYHSSLHLLELVDDVIDMERIEVQKIVISHESSEIGIIITEATNMVTDLIHAKGLELRVRIAPSLPLVMVDRLRIRQVILNLLVNAVRFTCQGWVEVSASLVNQAIKVSVTDSGRGISKEEQAHVFEEFHSGDQSQTKWHSGSGLGLPISKRLVELHKGEMGVDSEVGKGTTFWFTLPVDVPAIARTELHLRADSRPVEELYANQRILVLAHHDLSILNFVQRNLTDYRILGSESLEEAIKLAKESRCIALITSFEVPCSLPEDLLVIRVPMPDRHQLAEAMGANNLLVKPISKEQLIQAIQQVNQPIRRVLIADDDPDFVTMIHRMLVPMFSNGAFIEAYNGQEALDLIRQQRPELILLDMKMPILDGRGVLAQIHTDKFEPPPYTIIISGEVGTQIMDQLHGDIAISRGNGYPLTELLHSLDALVKLLSPGWFETHE